MNQLKQILPMTPTPKSDLASQLAALNPKYPVYHPLYGSAPAPLPRGLYPFTNDFTRTQIVRGLKLKRLRPKIEVDHMSASILDFKSKVRAFLPFCKQADIADLLTVTAMGVRPPSHNQTDEGRPVGSFFTIKFDGDILQSILRQWKPVVDLIREEDLSLAVPNGTNLGWPFLMADSKDHLRTFLLGSMALAVQSEREKGASLRDLLSQLAESFGPRFMVPGTRLQHSAKPIPFSAEGKQYWGVNLEPRSRMILMADKLSVLYNRIPAKKAIQAALRLPQHDQSRPYIQKKFDSWRALGASAQIIAVDVSGFDGGVGGDNLEVLLRLLAAITGANPADLIEEVRCPLLVPYGGETYFTESRIAPQLPSGISTTTCVGLLMGDYIALKLAKILGVRAGGPASGFDYLNWGDDFLICTSARLDLKKAFEELSAHTGMTFDFEPTLKYLGFNYGSAELEANLGYSFGRLLLKSVYPERPTAYPFSLIGYGARLNFVHDPEVFHRIYTDTFWGPHLREKFPYSELSARLSEALRAASVLPVSPDDLNFLLHGLQVDEGKALLEDLDVDFDFSTWIGGAYLPLVDPEKTISEFAPELTSKYARFIPQIKTGGVSALTNMVSHMAVARGLRMSKGQPIF